MTTFCTHAFDDGEVCVICGLTRDAVRQGMSRPTKPGWNPTTKPPRNILDVIKQVRELVPDGYDLLHHNLDFHAAVATYIAPECQPPNWDDLCILLANNLGKPDEEWKVKIAGIMKGTDENHQ